MFFRLTDTVALRSWIGTPHAYYVKNEPYARGLTGEEFDYLRLCDSTHDLQEQPLQRELIKRGLIEPCREGERPSEWSALRQYDNRYFPKMNLMITGKCNYNCLHCFNAADNSPLMSEWDFETLCRLLDEAGDCGIHALTLTGGEPMLYPGFWDLLREITARGMYVEELNTNGFFITREALEEMRENRCRPLVKISFDGIGCHEWMRARTGAEERTLNAIALCTEEGFPVKVQTQVNRRTRPVLLSTAERLEGMGVTEMRLIRTTEVERWEMNSEGQGMPLEEYYETMFEFARESVGIIRHMELDIWQFLKLYPEKHAYEIVPVMYGIGEYRDTAPVCRGNRGMIGITSDGYVIPCLQMSGYFTDHGMHMENLHDKHLKEILSGGRYYDSVCMTLKDLRALNTECGSCSLFEYCAGGCRALGGLFSSGDLTGPDRSKCLFFREGWYERITGAFAGWDNKKRIGTGEEMDELKIRRMFS